jgi:hypothetical protein
MFDDSQHLPARAAQPGRRGQPVTRFDHQPVDPQYFEDAPCEVVEVATVLVHHDRILPN